MVYSSFLLNYYFCFYFLFFSFNSLTVHHKKLACVIFTKKGPLSNIFTSTRSLCFCVLIVCLFVWVFFWFFFFCVCVVVCLCVCLDYSRTNEQIFIKKLWVGSDQRKKLLKERSGSYYGYKKIMNFQVPFQTFFNDFSFLLDISMTIN